MLFYCLGGKFRRQNILVLNLSHSVRRKKEERKIWPHAIMIYIFMLTCLLETIFNLRENARSAKKIYKERKKNSAQPENVLCT